MYQQKRWETLLKSEKDLPYFKDILDKIKNCKNQNLTIYPANKNIFKALEYFSPDQTKVVILGQDPYHGENQAQGLSFSVAKEVSIPPSLINIYKELQQDLGCSIPQHGNLEQWAKQGVLLLNTILTVEAGKPLSHKDIGWQRFTKHILSIINTHCSHTVFLLWGKNAQRYEIFIDQKKHTLLKSSHPSPLSSYRGFMGCKHFSLCNQALEAHNQTAINWQIR